MRRRATVLTGTLLLFSGTTGAAVATYPGANGKIAFWRDASLFLMDPDGSGRHRLTNFPSGIPRWSADGRRLVFSCRPTLQQGICTMNADGSDLRLVTSKKGQVPGDWSPDGTAIALDWYKPSTGRQVYVMSADGSRIRRLTSEGIFNEAPSWSPDGASIAYSAAGKLVVMNADGTDPRVVTDPPRGLADSWPDWSPDGKKLVFVRFPGIDGVPGDVLTVNVWTGATRNLTRSADRDDVSPAWAPDGSRIVFASALGDSARYDIYVMDPDGGQLQGLTDDARPDLGPHWQPV